MHAAIPAARGVEHPWRTLDLLDTAEAAITLREQHLVIGVPGKPPVSAPVGDIAVVLVRDNVTLSGRVLSALSVRGTAVLVCDWRGVPVGGTWPWREHSRIGRRTQAQVECPRPRQKQAWAAIVRAKITGQAWVLKSMVGGGSGWRTVREVADAVKSGDSGNREGVAAAAYWKQFRPRFIRDKTAGDPFNAALNYGYTVLRGHAIRAVAGAGLCPSIGIFHRGPSNQFALADDLIEPFRPSVDPAVLALHRDGELDMGRPQCRSRLVAASSVPMSGESGPTVAGAMTLFAQHLGAFFEGRDDVLSVPTWRGTTACG